MDTRCIYLLSGTVTIYRARPTVKIPKLSEIRFVDFLQWKNSSQLGKNFYAFKVRTKAWTLSTTTDVYSQKKGRQPIVLGVFWRKRTHSTPNQQTFLSNIIHCYFQEGLLGNCVTIRDKSSLVSIFVVSSTQAFGKAIILMKDGSYLIWSLHFFTWRNNYQTHADSIMPPPPCVLLCQSFNHARLNSHYMPLYFFWFLSDHWRCSKSFI